MMCRGQGQVPPTVVTLTCRLFWAETIRKKRWPSPSLPKRIERRTCSRKRTVTTHNHVTIWTRDSGQGGTRRGLFVQSLLCVPLFLITQQILLVNMSFFSSSCEFIPPLWRPHLYCLLLFQDDVYTSLCLTAFRISCLCGFPTQTKLNFVFSCESVSCQSDS